jgi:hypothetical protein
MRVVVNTSPLIALDRIGRLEILRALYGTVVRPQSVLEELKAGRGCCEMSSALCDADWIVTEPDPAEAVLRRELGPGEMAAIALAVRTKADLIILDDLQARFLADSVGLRLTGTLGVLMAAFKAGHITDVNRAVADLQASGFRVSERLVEHIRRATE